MLWTIDHTSAQRLQDQVAAVVVRGLRDGELSVGEQLPPAAELATALSVDRNTVLAAYRQLRDAGVLEFRRGRGARIAASTEPGDLAPVRDAVQAAIDLARRYGLGPSDVITLVKEMS
ncbi:GntR family transcriptional regulator [Angustibacter peucedani]